MTISCVGLTQVTLGFQLGGQAYSEVVLFKDGTALANFQSGRMKLGAQVSDVALDARAAADLAYRDGVMVMTMAKGGLCMRRRSAGRCSPTRP